MYIYCDRDGTVMRRACDNKSQIYSSDGWEVLWPRGRWVPRLGLTPQDLITLDVLSEQQAKQVAETNGLKWS
jgi:hypothetical protein